MAASAIGLKYAVAGGLSVIVRCFGVLAMYYIRLIGLRGGRPRDETCVEDGGQDERSQLCHFFLPGQSGNRNR